MACILEAVWNTLLLWFSGKKWIIESLVELWKFGGFGGHHKHTSAESPGAIHIYTHTHNKPPHTPTFTTLKYINI